MLKKILAIVVMLYATLAMAAVDVNKATDAQLDSIKGIGPITTKLIMSERKKGDFKSWQDFIDRVKGIGETSAIRLSENGLTLNGQSYKPTAASKDSKADKKEAKADAKADKTLMKADTKAEKAEAKADKKEAKAEAKIDAKSDKPVAKVDAAKPAASAAKK